MSERLVLGASAQAHIDAYLEYVNIVGESEDGRLLSEAEYEEKKKKAIEASKNRIYVVWQNVKTGMDCRVIGPSTKCMHGIFLTYFFIFFAVVWNTLFACLYCPIQYFSHETHTFLKQAFVDTGTETMPQMRQRRKR